MKVSDIPHGTKSQGIIGVDFPAEQFIDAMTELDVNIPRDGASGQAYGAFFVTHSQDPATATRHHARKAYYDPAAGRPNLHLLTGNRVTRLITEPSCGGPKVAAVEVSMRLT
jgi:choline dehydrogenase-like flavoprotein